VQIPAGAQWNVPDASEAQPRKGKAAGQPQSNPWKSSVPFARAELDKMLSDGIAGNAMVDFETVSFGGDLVPAAAVLFPDARAPQGKGSLTQFQSRGYQVAYTWVDKAPGELRLTVTGGQIYLNRGEVKIGWFPAADVEGKAADEATVPTDGRPHQVVLKTAQAGLHRIEWSDNMSGAAIEWPTDRPMTLELTLGPRYDAETYTFWFYVPKGTRMVGGFAKGGTGAVLDPAGKAVYQLQGTGYFRLPVPPGQDGRLWRFQGHVNKAHFMLMTVPAMVALRPQDLLLPQEVVRTDAPKK
jgi:hypothetical protein